MLSKLNQIKFSTDIGDIDQHFAQFFHTNDGEGVADNFKGWSFLKFMIAQFLYLAIVQNELPQELQDLYFAAVQSFGSLKDIKVVSESKSFVLGFHNVTLGGIIPNRIDLGLEKVEQEPTWEHFKLLLPKVISTDGGQESEHYSVENVVENNMRVYCTQIENNVNIVLECPERVLITHVIVKLPLAMFTAPCKSGLVWISDEQPKVEDTAQYDNFNSADTVGLPGGAVLCFDVPDAHSTYNEYKLANPCYGRFVHIKLLRAIFPGRNIDIQYIGLVAFSGDPFTIPEVANVGEKLGICRFH